MAAIPYLDGIQAFAYPLYRDSGGTVIYINDSSNWTETPLLPWDPEADKKEDLKEAKRLWNRELSLMAQEHLAAWDHTLVAAPLSRCPTQRPRVATIRRSAKAIRNWRRQ